MILGGMVYTQYSDFVAERETTYIKLNSYAKFSGVFHKLNDRWPANFMEVVLIRKTDRSTTDFYGFEIEYEPYDEDKGYGSVISYGKDGKVGGDKGAEQDIHVRFPIEKYKAWNETQFYGKPRSN